MKISAPLLSVLFVFASFYSCNSQGKKKGNQEIENKFSSQFSDYWYEGKAEINAYDLQQARYGELRNGEAVMVFVTEDFLIEQQVKKESNTTAAATSVLKLNFIRKFPTGIYDYSMMTSTFSPVNQEQLMQPLKSTTSAQEWCGHSWLQLNRENEKFSLSSYSYFEREGDLTKTVSPELVEDALWGIIRQNPELIEVGEHAVFPSAHYLRFAHKELKSYKAIISKSSYAKEDMPGSQLAEIKLVYPELERELKIIYESEFPFRIAGWKETRLSGGKKMQTTATKKSDLKSAYWGQNSKSDSYLRDSLKLK